MKRYTLAAFFVAICGASIAQTTTTDKFVVYQMMIRLFGNQNTTNTVYGTMAENGVGKFGDVSEKALAELKQFGADYVWYTGVIEHATMVEINGVAADDADVVKGRAGSPYAIKDYYDVNGYLAEDYDQRIMEFKALIERTHQAGLKVIIDLVPNHVARTYESDMAPDGIQDFGSDDDDTKTFAPNNNFYYIPGEKFVVPTAHNPLGDEVGPREDDQFNEFPAKVSGNDVFKAQPSKDDWFETIKLNYGRDYQGGENHFDPIPDTWEKIRHIVSYWAEMGVDGFRCDMAEMVPAEFWGWMIPKVQADFPGTIFIAEIYNPNSYENYLNTGKFTYLYDKVGVYDALRACIEHRGEVAKVHSEVAGLASVDQQMLRFVENHDEQRSASEHFGKTPAAGLAMSAASMLMGKGPYMHYFGQEVGVNGDDGPEGFQGKDGRTTIFDFWGVTNHQLWMNGGAFDGGQLPDSLKALRNAYQSLIQYMKTNADHLTNANYTEVEGLPNNVLGFTRSTADKQITVYVELSGKSTEISYKGVKLWSPSGVITPSATGQFDLPAYGVVVVE